MATYEELIAAARKADAAGESNDARRLLEMAVALRDKPPEAPKPPGQGVGNNVAQAAGDGLFLGFGDEISARLNALAGYDASTGTYGNRTSYDEQLQAVRGQEEQFREDHPVVSIGAELAGTLPTAVLPAAGIVRGASTLSRLGRAAGAGAALGGAYGFGEGEGGIADRAQGGMLNGLLGGAVGLASVPVAAGLRTAASPIVGAVRNMMPGASVPAAQNALVSALNNAGMDATQVSNALAMSRADDQGVFTIADALGMSGQRALAGAARQGGDAKVLASRVLDQRQAGQGDRLSGAITDALGERPAIPGTGLVPWRRQGADEIAEGTARAQQALAGRPSLKTAEATRARMTDARGAAANTAYDAARRNAGPVDVRGALAAIDDRIGPMQGSGIRGDGIDAKLAGYRSRLAAQPPGPRFQGADGVELSDFDRVLGVKQAIQDDIGAAVRAGRNNEARELGKIVSQLDEALEASSDGYRAANDSFRRASREIDQIDRGLTAARPGQRADDTVAQYRGLRSEGERAPFRAGYADRVLGRIESSAEGVNKARPLTSDKARTELGAMARDPARLSRQVERENTMFQTRGAALGGSQTADNLADMASTNWLASRVPTGVMDAAAMGVNALGNLARGHNSATREMIVRQLLSTGDEAAAALAQAVQRGERLSLNQQRALIAYLTGGVGSTNQLAR